jgi:Leucine-rich repeat (LRR) protein
MSGNTSITAAGDKAIAEGMGSATASQTIADLDAEEVSLSSTSLATAQVVGIAAMLSQSRVHTLSLTYADVDDVGATALADALRASPQLTSLSLHGNNITDVGATAIASVLGASNVKSLALTSNNMTNEGAWAVLDALEGAEVDEDEDEDE